MRKKNAIIFINLFRLLLRHLPFHRAYPFLAIFYYWRFSSNSTLYLPTNIFILANYLNRIVILRWSKHRLIKITVHPRRRIFDIVEITHIRYISFCFPIEHRRWYNAHDLQLIGIDLPFRYSSSTSSPPPFGFPLLTSTLSIHSQIRRISTNIVSSIRISKHFE